MSQQLGNGIVPGYSLPLSSQKEELSYGLLHAIAAQVGFTVTRPPTDYDSIDVTISARRKLVSDSKLVSPKLDVQLKASVVPILASDSFSFTLSIKNYDDLRCAERASPIILAVLLLPRDSKKWLKSDESSLVAKRCTYWLCLQGMEPTDNETTQNVTIPRSNVLSPQTLLELMIKVSRQEELRHV